MGNIHNWGCGSNVLPAFTNWSLKLIQAVPFPYVPETLGLLPETSKSPDSILTLNIGFNELQGHLLQATVTPVSRPPGTLNVLPTTKNHPPLFFG